MLFQNFERSYAVSLTIEILNIAGNKFGELFELQQSDGTPLSQEEWPLHLATQGKFIQGNELRVMRKDTGVVTATEISTTAIRNRDGEIERRGLWPQNSKADEIANISGKGHVAANLRNQSRDGRRKAEVQAA